MLIPPSVVARLTSSTLLKSTTSQEFSSTQQKEDKGCQLLYTLTNAYKLLTCKSQLG